MAPTPVQAKPVSHVPRAATPPPAAVQQTWPPAPQASHMPPAPFTAPTQRPPPWQIAPGQQAPPTAPQFSQVRAPVGGFAQAKAPVQVLPAQQP
jgi:hypothetical protein